jgi:hypothetical protein
VAVFAAARSNRSPAVPGLATASGARAQLIVGILAGIAAAAVTLVVVGHGTTKAAAILIIVAGTLWFATTRRTKLALALLTLYLGLLDGYLKLSTGSTAVSLVRDVLLYAICAGLLVRAVVDRRPLPLPAMTGWIVAFVAVVLVQLANPGDGTLYHSLAGVRQQLEFIPIFFLAAAYVRTKQTLRVFLILLLVIGAANGIVSWVQFHESPGQLAAWGPGYAERIDGTGGFQFAGRTFYSSTGQQYTRPFGLGSDSGGGGVAGMLALAAGFGILLTSRSRRRTLLIAVALAIGSAIAVYTSEGRSAVVGTAIVIFAFGFLATTVDGRKGKLLALAVGLVVSFLVVQSFITSNNSTDSRYSGLTAGSLLSTTSQARGQSYAIIGTNLRKYPLGAGLGVSGPASGVKGAPPLAGQVDAENELSFLIDETGIPGALVLIGMTVRLIWLGVRRIKLEPDPEIRLLLSGLVAALAGLFAIYAVSAITPTTPGGPFLWATAGIIAYWLVERPKERAAIGLAA